jgi:hypothetical protein
MKCGRCGGSVIDVWDDVFPEESKIHKCISCGHEQLEGGNMAEMTEEQKAAKLEYQREYRKRHPLTEEQKAKRAARAKERFHERKGSRAAKKEWKTRKRTARPSRRAVPASAGAIVEGKVKDVLKALPGGKPSFYLPIEGLFLPAQEVRIELVYQLAGVKIVKE